MTEPNPPLRIGYYCISTELGGAERSLFDLALSIKEKFRSEISMEFIFPKPTGPFIDLLAKNEFNIHILKLPQTTLRLSRSQFISQVPFLLLQAPFLLMYLYRFVKIIRYRKYDIVHTTGLKCHILSSILPLTTSSSVLWHIRDIYSRRIIINSLKFLKSLPNISVIYNSKASANVFEKSGKVIYNGFHTPLPPTTKPLQIKKELGIPSDSQLIGLIGVIARWKGQKQFIEMAKSLCSKNKKLHFLIIGDTIYDTSGENGYKEEVQRLCSKYLLNDNVHFLGFRRDVETLLQQLDVFVHASIKPEPFGRVIVEAMLNNVPVVAANAGGVREIIEHQKTGLLCPPGDIESYAQAISSILQNKNKAKELSQKAYQVATNQFLIESHVQNMIDTYFKISKKVIHNASEKLSL